MRTPTKALVVLSGGQDSTTCLAIAKASGIYSEIHAVTFDYDQRHSAELQAASNIAKLVGVDSHEIIKIGPILGGMSPLTNKDEQLETYEDHASMEAIIGTRVEKTFVPMRNAMFLTIAANRAAILGCADIYTGVCQEDNANYPDCRQIFIESQEDVINYALGRDLTSDDSFRIRTPLMHFSKANSIKVMLNSVKLPLNVGDVKADDRGLAAYALLAFSHTAYDGVYPPVGKDHASVLRAHGFEEAGLPDPLVFRAYLEGLMPMPTTKNYQGCAVDFLNNLTLAIEAYGTKLGIDEPNRVGITGHAPSVTQAPAGEGAW